jgi:hypothetical protein
VTDDCDANEHAAQRATRLRERSCRMKDEAV